MGVAGKGGSAYEAHHSATVGGLARSDYRGEHCCARFGPELLRLVLGRLVRLVLLVLLVLLMLLALPSRARWLEVPQLLKNIPILITSAPEIRQPGESSPVSPKLRVLKRHPLFFHNPYHLLIELVERF